VEQCNVQWSSRSELASGRCGGAGVLVVGRVLLRRWTKGWQLPRGCLCPYAGLPARGGRRAPILCAESLPSRPPLSRASSPPQLPVYTRGSTDAAVRVWGRYLPPDSHWCVVGGCGSPPIGTRPADSCPLPPPSPLAPLGSRARVPPQKSPRHRLPLQVRQPSARTRARVPNGQTLLSPPRPAFPPLPPAGWTRSRAGGRRATGALPHHLFPAPRGGLQQEREGGIACGTSRLWPILSYDLIRVTLRASWWDITLLVGRPPRCTRWRSGTPLAGGLPIMVVWCNGPSQIAVCNAMYFLCEA